jgi:hypothetical protein
LRLRRVSSSCPSKGAWDKGVMRRNPIMQGVEASAHDPVRKLRAIEGAKNPRLNFSRAFQ